MARTVVQKIKGHHYLYEVRSEWDPDTGKMKQKRKYLGRCDASGNLYSSKPARGTSLSFGQYYLAAEVARRCGLPEAIERVMGRIPGHYTTAYAIVRMLRLTSPSQQSSYLRNSFLMKMYGLEYDRKWSDMPAYIERLTELYDRRYELFDQLSERNDTEIFELNSLNGEFRFLDLDWSKTSYGFNSMPHTTVYIAHSQTTKLPFYFFQAPHGVSKATIMNRLSRDLAGLGSQRNSFFFDIEDLNKKTAEELAGSGYRLSIKFGEKSQFGRIVMRGIGELSERDFVTHMLDARIYRVHEHRLTVGTRDVRILVVIDERRRNGEIRTLHDYIDRILQISDMKDTSDDEKLQMASMNDYIDALNAFDYSRESDGLRFTIDQSELFEIEQRCGRTLFMVTDNRDWDDIVRMSHSSDAYEHDLSQFKTDLEEGATLFQSNREAIASIMNDFLAIRIRMMLRSMIQNSSLRGKMSSTELIAEMGNIFATHDSDKWLLTEYTDNQKALLEALDIEVPTQLSLRRFE